MTEPLTGSFLFGAPDTMGVPSVRTSAEAFIQTLPIGEGLGEHLAGLPGPFVFASSMPDRSGFVLGRDRLGRNRLFYHIDETGVRWSTDLVSFAQEVRPKGLSNAGLRELLGFRWNMSRGTPLHSIRQVQPGTLVRIDGQGREEREYYWTLELSPDEAAGSLEGWVDETEAALRAGLTRILDGAGKPFVLLSGGVDSALEAAVGHSIRPDLVAVTPEWANNPSPELPRAQAVAEHLGIEHRIMYLKAEDLIRFTPETIRYFGGPIRDYHMVMLAWVYDQLAPEGFDLVLHGQAADTFFGAPNLGFAEKFGRKRRILEVLPRRLLERVAERLPERTDRGKRLGILLGMDVETALFRNHRLGHNKAFRRAFPHWLDFRDPRSGIMERVPAGGSPRVRVQMSDFYQGTISHMVTSTSISTPHGITMGYPFLTDEVLDVARRLPDVHKRRGGEAKPVLKDLGARFFPAEWMQAPKLGFPTPTIEWLEGPLAPWIGDRLGPGSFSRALLGDDLVEALELPDDFELIWTLANIEEFLSVAFPEVGRETMQVLEP